MTPVLVDSCVLIDIATDDAVWGGWSAETLARIGRNARLILNPLIYAEVSVAFQRIEDVEALLPEEIFAREALPWPAAFLAGKAFLAYLRRGGVKAAPLPDFYIGAHAAIRGYRLLTRDRGRYATAFPKLQLIVPEDPAS